MEPEPIFPDDELWMEKAKCRGDGPNDYFPSDGLGVEAVKATCQACPVQEQCLEYALENRIEHGVWGGASERERRRIIRQRRRLRQHEP
ncbi:MAG: putative WhiB family transcriptional regulator [Candidatus Saccharibacteria bacterium]|nr:putative WhiB family transcriptional regulator [Candidatus Saccharibacteria bacterium]